jgi:hypothetical protein
MQLIFREIYVLGSSKKKEVDFNLLCPCVPPKDLKLVPVWEILMAQAGKPVWIKPNRIFAFFS